MTTAQTPVSIPTADATAEPDDRRANGITALRLGLALLVLAFHAWPVGGYGEDPLTQITGGRLDGGGTLAVYGFFGLSGFLLVGSRSRLSAPSFLWRRSLRILPAYWVSIVLTGLVVGAAYVTAAYLPYPSVATLTWAGFATNPLGNINASLWTLWPEIACYLMLALLPPTTLRRVLPIVAAVLALSIASGQYRLPILGVECALGIAFVAGGLIALWRIPLRGVVALALLPAWFVTVGTFGGEMVGPIAFAYLAVLVGLRLPLRWTTDLSYGTYIYAFPVAQFAMLAGLGRFGPAGLIAATAAVTVPIAAASWYLVERPALDLKRLPQAALALAPWS